MAQNLILGAGEVWVFILTVPLAGTWLLLISLLIPAAEINCF